MKSIIFIGLFALISSGISLRETRHERRLRKIIPLLSKDKRGTSDTSSYGSNGPSYFTPINAPISGYALGGSAGGLSVGQSNPAGLDTTAGYQGHGLGQSFGLASLALGSHGQAYSLPLTYASSLLPSTKTGPVTFGLQGSSQQNYATPVYATGVQGLSAYSTGAQGLSLPLLSLASHGAYSSPTSSSYSTGHGGLITSATHQGYSLPISSAPSSHSMSGGLVFAGTHGYSSPSPSASSISSSHSTYPTASPLSGYHIGLNGVSDSSRYSLPITSSYPVDASYQSSDNSHSSAASYAFPSTNYGSPTTSFTGHSSPNVIYSPASSTYPGHSSSYSTYNSPSANYASSSSHSSPSVTYSSPGASSNHADSPAYSSQSYGYSTPEQQGSYSNVSPTYLNYAKAYRNSKGDHKYDTLSYSRQDEKY